MTYKDISNLILILFGFLSISKWWWKIRKIELDAEFESKKKLARIKMRTPMLIQASKM